MAFWARGSTAEPEWLLFTIEAIAVRGHLLDRKARHLSIGT